MGRLDIKNLENIIDGVRWKMQARAMRIDADDENSNNRNNNNNNSRKKSTGIGTRLPYALCKNLGIDTTGMTPREAWDAYYGKSGVKPEAAYKEHFADGEETAEKEEKKEKFSEINDDNFEEAQKYYEEIKKEVKGRFTDNKEYTAFANSAKIGNVGKWFDDDKEADEFIAKAEEYANLLYRLEAYYMGTEAKPVRYLRQNASRGERLRACEDRNRHDKKETAVILGEDGKVLVDKSDNMDGQVSFTAEQAKQMRNATLTHNHPNDSPFSDADLQTAFTAGLREMRATTKTGAFSLRRKFEIGDDIPEKYMYFAVDYDDAEKKYRKDVIDEVYKTTGDAKKCNGMDWDFCREWLKKHSSEYGWEYSEETL